jgi:hypothetical protein
MCLNLGPMLTAVMTALSCDPRYMDMPPFQASP